MNNPNYMSDDAQQAAELLNIVLKASVCASDDVSKLVEQKQTVDVKRQEIKALGAILEAMNLASDFINRINDGIKVGNDDGNENRDAD